MAAIARWCYQHRITVLTLWVLAVLGIGVSESIAGTGYVNDFALPGTESNKAQTLLQDALPAQAGDQDTIVWRVTRGSVDDPEVRTRMTAVLEKVGRSPSVGGVASPYDANGAQRVSADKRTAYATVTFTEIGPEVDRDHVQKVVDLATAARTDTLEVELGGNAVGQLNQSATSSAELIGVVAAAVVLLVAFGSLLAMLLPLTIAVLSLIAATMSIGLLSHVLTVYTLAPTIAALIGLGVGIDYALFIVTRHRDGLKAGMPVEESVIRALNTSGRAVIFAGGTVCVALLGLLVLGVSFLDGIGISAAVMVVVTVIGSITLLPALLGFIGTRVLSRRERRDLAENGPQSPHATGLWARWSSFVSRRPTLLVPIALVVIAVLAVPVLSLRLGSSDQGNDPESSTTRKAYDLLADGFGPGFNGPLQLVAELKSSDDRQAFTAMAGTLRDTTGVAAAAPLPVQNTRIGILVVYPTTSPQDAETSDLIERLRTETVPAAEAGTTMQIHVGGQTAIFDDFADVLANKLPQFIAVVIALGFLLLLVAFRSLLIPLTAAVMNLLSVAASFGVVVAVFQWGWGEPVGLGKAGPVDAFLPVMMLAILFGLSMDYQVFLVSRMHEEWVHTRNNRLAVTVGQSSTGRIITAAAIIMICVFVAFAFGGQRVIAEFGIGLASAVLIDAFVLRTVLVPAVMHLLGSANWWLPGWMDRWLPHLAVEPAEDAAAQPASEPASAGTSG